MKIETAEFVLTAVKSSQFQRDDRPEVAFVGRSNVGKSSLMNKLLGKRGLARTSSTPGRTQAVNYFLVNRRFWFVDLPGYGYAKASKADRDRWAQLMNDYFAHRDEPRRLLLIQLVDAKVGATELDRQATDYFVSLQVPILVAATKVDKLGRSKHHQQMRSIGEALELPQGAGPIAVSAVTGEGMQSLWTEIRAFLDA